MASEKKQSHSWWFASHNNPTHSPWLLSTLSELDEKIKRTLQLMEGDGDSFAKRVDTYYNKRPEIMNSIEELYRSYRSLAERYDKLRKKERDSHESFSDSGGSADSEVDDPDEGEFKVDIKNEEISVELVKEEVGRLKKENEKLRGELEVIRKISKFCSFFDLEKLKKRVVIMNFFGGHF